MESLPKVFPYYVSTSGCDYHRIRLPFQCAEGLNDNDAYTGFRIELMMEYIAKSDVVVINRMFPQGVDKLLEFQRMGVKVVVDLDDWWELPWKHPLYNQYKNFTSHEILACLKVADAVTVTTSRLAVKARQINPNVHIIPNALPYGRGQFTERPSKEPGIFSFVYTGQASHLEDVRMLVNPFRRVKQLPGIGFHLAGVSEGRVWQDIERVFSCMPNYQRIQSRPLDDYMQVYDDADCLLVPLVDNQFNWHKSNLKLLEAAAKKIPVICSHVPPYSDCAEAPVLWVKKQSDWYEHIKYLSRHREAAIQMGEDLHKWAVERYDLYKWNKIRFDLYKSLQ